MSVPVQRSRKRRLHIPDDETKDAPGVHPGAPHGMTASEHAWVNDFMARLAASVRSLRRSQ